MVAVVCCSVVGNLCCKFVCGVCLIMLHANCFSLLIRLFVSWVARDVFGVCLRGCLWCYCCVLGWLRFSGLGG